MRGLYKREGSETWYVLVYHEGKRVRASTGTSNKKEAQAFYDRFCTELRARSAASGSVTWESACVRWLKAATRSDNDRYILRALNYTDRPLNQCTPESFESALEHLTNATYNRYRAIIVAVCNLSGHKLKLPTKKTKRGRLRFLTREEWDRLYAELPKHLKPLAAFAIATGLRQKNVTQLRWDQIDMPGRKMWVHADTMKANRAIGIPLSSAAMEVLEGQVGLSKEWVFPYAGRGRSNGNPISKIKTAWQKAMERAGLGRFEYTDDGSKKWVGDFTWHGLRHTWASWHLMAGTPMHVLKELGGWRDMRMVLEYAHLSTDHLQGWASNATPYSREHEARECPSRDENQDIQDLGVNAS